MIQEKHQLFAVMAQDNYLERLFSSSTPEGKRMRVRDDAPFRACESLLPVNSSLTAEALLTAVIEADKASAEGLAMTVSFEMPMMSLQA